MLVLDASDPPIGLSQPQIQWVGAQLSVASMSNIDGVFYYLPEAATPACGSNGWGTLGICAVGLLTRINNPSVDNAVPPYTGINRNYGSWNARCFARYQRAGRAARANIIMGCNSSNQVGSAPPNANLPSKQRHGH